MASLTHRQSVTSEAHADDSPVQCEYSDQNDAAPAGNTYITFSTMSPSDFAAVEAQGTKIGGRTECCTDQAGLPTPNFTLSNTAATEVAVNVYYHGMQVGVGVNNDVATAPAIAGNASQESVALMKAVIAKLG